MKIKSPASGKRQGLDKDSHQINSSTITSELPSSHNGRKTIVGIICHACASKEDAEERISEYILATSFYIAIGPLCRVFTPGVSNE